MKKFLLITALTTAASCAFAQSSSSTASSAPAAAATAPDPGAEKHARLAMAGLHLDDPAKEAKVHDILVDFVTALKKWHAANDAQIKPLWTKFSAARNTHDPAKIQGAIDALEAAYASFKPAHEDFVARLRTVISPEQIESIEDAFTVKKVEVTFHSYEQIFPALTDEQKAVILKNLKGAREEAIDAESMMEKSAFFKKWKDKIEAYLTGQGYDVKKSYAEFGEKLKAQMAAQKAASAAGTTPAANKPADATKAP